MCDLAASEAKIDRDDEESVGKSCGQKHGGRPDEESAVIFCAEKGSPMETPKPCQVFSGSILSEHLCTYSLQQHAFRMGSMGAMLNDFLQHLSLSMMIHPEA